jgi:hypothetical protein
VRTHDVPAHHTGCRTGRADSLRLRPGPDGRVWMSAPGQPSRRVHPEDREVRDLTSHAPQRPAAVRRGRQGHCVDPGLLGQPAATGSRHGEVPGDRPARPRRSALHRTKRSRDGSLWIGTAAADALLRYRPESGRFDAYRCRLAARWYGICDRPEVRRSVAYGASPGIPARIARVVPVDAGSVIPSDVSFIAPRWRRHRALFAFAVTPAVAQARAASTCRRGGRCSRWSIGCCTPWRCATPRC